MVLASRRKTASGYGRYLAWLRDTGKLEPSCLPQERVTKEIVTGYVDHLAAYNRGYTVLCRVQELYDAIRVMAAGAGVGVAATDRLGRPLAHAACQEQDRPDPASPSAGRAGHGADGARGLRRRPDAASARRAVPRRPDDRPSRLSAGSYLQLRRHRHWQLAPGNGDPQQRALCRPAGLEPAALCQESGDAARRIAKPNP